MVECPLECIWRESPPSWLEKHEGFMITMVGLIGGGLGGLLAYFMRSRCTKIKCCGAGCVREPLTVQEIKVIDSTTAAPAP